MINATDLIKEVLNDINLKNKGKLVLKDIRVVVSKTTLALQAILEHEEIIDEETIRYSLNYFFDENDIKKCRKEVYRKVTKPYKSSIGTKEKRFGNLCESYEYHSSIGIKQR